MIALGQEQSRGNRHGRRTLKLYALVLCGLLVSGCGFFGGGSEGSSQAPEGYASASTQSVSFAYPQTWEKLPDDAYPDGWPVAFGGPHGQVAVFVKLPETTDPVLASAVATDGLRNNTENFEFNIRKDVQVSGADKASRGTYTYAGVSEGKLTGKTIRGTDVVMVDEDGNVVLVRITGIKGKLSDQTVNQIVDSIVMK